ncbi:hypothetical protein SAMN04488696_2778 [Methanolobus profundi]|uniref:Uncharacterized protein n=1 Tax=Methanolobus profundi TaxID=487685 RepID=A0A1I4ULJ9_9EURY|nr:hypothetical protein SAMN04488696_2778 [Methanolobus profundi]
MCCWTRVIEAFNAAEEKARYVHPSKSTSTHSSAVSSQIESEAQGVSL